MIHPEIPSLRILLVIKRIRRSRYWDTSEQSNRLKRWDSQLITHIRSILNRWNNSDLITLRITKSTFNRSKKSRKKKNRKNQNKISANSKISRLIIWISLKVSMSSIPMRRVSSSRPPATSVSVKMEKIRCVPSPSLTSNNSLSWLSAVKDVATNHLKPNQQVHSVNKESESQLRLKAKMILREIFIRVIQLNSSSQRSNSNKDTELLEESTLPLKDY